MTDTTFKLIQEFVVQPEKRDLGELEEIKVLCAHYCFGTKFSEIWTVSYDWLFDVVALQLRPEKPHTHRAYCCCIRL